MSSPCYSSLPFSEMLELKQVQLSRFHGYSSLPFSEMLEYATPEML